MKRSFPGLLAFCLLLHSAGCGPHQNTPVDVNVAQETLQTTLENWKLGLTPEEMQNGTPKIVVQDMDWSSGAELLSYEIQSDSRPMDANLVAKVKLTLRDQDGKEVQKTATYVVGTSPVLTVFRDMMQ
jgi:hypothetical protein